MNVNEVVSYVANEYLKEHNSDETIHPNDDVNKSQSSNDTFPTAMHVALYHEVETKLEPALKNLRNTLKRKKKININQLLKLDVHIYKMQPH